MRTNLLCIDTHKLYRDHDAEEFVSNPTIPLPAVMIGIDGRTYAPVENTLAYEVPVRDLVWDEILQVVRRMTDAELTARDAAEEAQRAADDEAQRIPRAWAAIKAGIDARMHLGNLLESTIWDGYRMGDYLAAHRDQLLLSVARYRQALREVTTVYATPDAVEWPAVPSLLAAYVPVEYTEMIAE
jgi:hypothetical protein